jgi:hypothetical protein
MDSEYAEHAFLLTTDSGLSLNGIFCRQRTDCPFHPVRLLDQSQRFSCRRLFMAPRPDGARRARARPGVGRRTGKSAPIPERARLPGRPGAFPYRAARSEPVPQSKRGGDAAAAAASTH